VERAVDILEALASAGRPLTVLELGRGTTLSRPTLYRLLGTLAARGLVRAEGDGGRYRLGPALMRLAHISGAETDIAAMARPVLEALRAETGETAALFLLRDETRLCLLEVVSRHALAISRGVGETEHISRGASGKAMLAFIPEDDPRRASAMATVPAGTDLAQLQRALRKARRDGFATSAGEKFPGAVAIAAPVLDHMSAVVGSVGLFGPEVRLPPARVAALARRVVQAAEAISREIGAPTSGAASPLRRRRAGPGSG
jgi:IclR family acetate operon transcriptional repressor